MKPQAEGTEDTTSYHDRCLDALFRLFDDMCKPLTEQELHTVALLYCSEHGIDPDQPVSHSAPPNADGTVNCVLLFTPRIEIIKQEIRQKDYDSALMFRARALCRQKQASTN